jgi:mutator protein MutT
MRCPPVLRSEPLCVVAGIVVSGAQVLVARRRKSDHLGGLWEFPGGKVRTGESPERALERELHEELRIRVRVGPLWGILSHRERGRRLALHFYFAGIETGTPRSVGCDEHRWAAPGDLWQLPFPEPDRLLLDELIRCGRAGIPLESSRHTPLSNREENE